MKDALALGSALMLTQFNSDYKITAFTKIAYNNPVADYFEIDEDSIDEILELAQDKYLSNLNMLHPSWYVDIKKGIDITFMVNVLELFPVQETIDKLNKIDNYKFRLKPIEVTNEKSEWYVKFNLDEDRYELTNDTIIIFIKNKDNKEEIDLERLMNVLNTKKYGFSFTEPEFKGAQYETKSITQPKFEYKKQYLDVVNMSPNSVQPNYTPEVIKLGEEGWELVSTYIDRSIVVGYFKRLIQ